MNAPLHGRFEQSFARHMIRGCFPLLLVVAAVELSIRYAVLRFDFRTAGPHCVQRPAAQQAEGEFGELAQGLNPFLDTITLVVRGLDCILGGGVWVGERLRASLARALRPSLGQVVTRRRCVPTGLRAHGVCLQKRPPGPGRPPSRGTARGLRDR